MSPEADESLPRFLGRGGPGLSRLRPSPSVAERSWQKPHKVVDYAVIASHRSSPSYTKNTVIGALIGFIIAAAIIVISYIRDDIIHSEDYLTTTYPDIPLLTVVPDLITSRQNGYGYYSTAVARSGDKVRKTYADSAASVAEQRAPFVIDAKSGSDGDKNG